MPSLAVSQEEQILQIQKTKKKKEEKRKENVHGRFISIKNHGSNESEIKMTDIHSCIRNDHLKSAPKFQWEMLSKLKKTYIKLVTEQAIILTVL